MKPFFQDIFKYHHHFNQKFIEQITENLESLPERVVSLLSHNINAHLVWNARILERNFPTMQEVYSLEKVGALDKENYDITLDIINNQDLEEIIQYENSKGESFENSLRDILFHVANHHTHHRGQVISDIRLSGIAPVMSDYIFFKR